MNEQSAIIIYTTEDGATNLQVKMENETVWLSTSQMAELFNREESNIRRHMMVRTVGSALPTILWWHLR